jgi:hypothetical protein
LVVQILRVKIGPFCGYNVTLSLLLFCRVDVKLPYLGILCILCFSSLSIEECHNILPCKRALRPSQNRTCGFPTSGSSAKLTQQATITSLIEIGGQSCQRYVFHLCVWHTPLIPRHFAARPFECPELKGLDRHYPIYTSTMTWSDCHIVLLPPCLFSLLEASIRNDMALPSSAVNPRMTRHGLRPRHVAVTLAIIACSTPGFQATKPLAQCKLEKFRGLKPSLALWLTIHLSLSLAYLVTSIHIKFRSGLAANLWPGWIVQLTHNSFA